MRWKPAKKGDKRVKIIFAFFPVDIHDTGESIWLEGRKVEQTFMVRQLIETTQSWWSTDKILGKNKLSLLDWIQFKLGAKNDK